MEYNEEIKKVVIRERPTVGDGEYEVCYNRVLEANNGKQPTSKQIIEALDDWRKPFTKGVSYASKEAWDAMYAQSERAARELLLQSSAEMKTLTALEKQAIELQRKAKEQEAKLNTWYAEFNGLPAKAAAYHTRLSVVTAQRNELDSAYLDVDFTAAYTALVGGNLAYTAKVDQLAARIATRDLRLSILKEIEAEC